MAKGRRHISFLKKSGMKTLFLLIFILWTIINFKCCTNELNKGSDQSRPIHLNIFMIVTEWSSIRQKQLSNCMRTMQSHLNSSTCDVHFHILVDATTTQHVLDVVCLYWCQTETSDVKLSLYNIQMVEAAVAPYHHSMMKYFSSDSNLYYNRTIFFVEAVLHVILPEDVKRVIVFDIDIKFNSSVEKLYTHFQNFSRSNVIGLAFEQQPTYMHYTTEYRKSHPLTRIGSPPPDGLPGFNSGVILMELYKIRNCDIYNQALLSVNLQALADKYLFRGNLGDQDFFTLLSFEYPELFYVLPCTWNRQLCRWFETHGYHEYFNTFHNCQGDINIYHGNCNSTLPEL